MSESPLYIAPTPLDVATLRRQQSAGGGGPSRADQSGDAFMIMSMGHRINVYSWNTSAKYYYPENGSISANGLSIDEEIRGKICLFSLESILKGYYSSAAMSKEAYAIDWGSCVAALFIPCEKGRLGIAYRVAKGSAEDAQEMCKLLAQAVCERNKEDAILQEHATKFLLYGKANAEAKNEQT